MNYHRRRWPVLVLLCAVACAWPVDTASFGQVVTDGTLGAAGALAGPDFQIPHTLGQTRGNNLFHSFSQFDIQGGESATFSGPANITNVLARVTGGSASRIDGTLKTQGMPAANLYLINPSGVILAPGAALEVAGAFVATTADVIELGPNGRFNAADPAQSALTSAPPSAFGFLGASPAAVQIDSARLGVATGKTLAVVAGDVTMSDARLAALDGRIALAAVRSAGSVAFDPADDAAPLTLADGQAPGDVSMSNGSLANVSGNGGGRVVIRAGQLTVVDSEIRARSQGANGGGVDLQAAADLRVTRSTVSTKSSGAANAGDIDINAGGAVVIEDGALISANTLASSAAAGRVQVEADSLTITDGAQVVAKTSGAGAAGRVQIDVGEFVIDGVDGLDTGVFAGTSAAATGAGGDIHVNVQTLRIVDTGVISATSNGPSAGGAVYVAADSIFLDGRGLVAFTGIGANTQSLDADAGAGGAVHVEAGTLHIIDEAAVAANTFGPGAGGGVDLVVDQLLIEGAGPGTQTGIFAATLSTSASVPGGPGGDIHVEAGRVDISAGGQITAESRGGGRGGTIGIEAAKLTLSDGGRIQSAATGDGDAGMVTIDVAGVARLIGGSAVATFAQVASGGDLRLTAGDAVQLHASQITAQAAGDGGNVKLTTPGTVELVNSQVTAMAQGSGGNIDIDPRAVILDHSALNASAIFGNGGDITIVTSVFLLSPGSVIDASSQFGVSGNIQIVSPETDIAGGLVQLPGSLVGSQVRLAEYCALRFQGDYSSFIVVGQGGLPVQPGELLPGFHFNDTAAGDAGLR